jgi:hypothetical protein
LRRILNGIELSPFIIEGDRRVDKRRGIREMNIKKSGNYLFFPYLGEDKSYILLEGITNIIIRFILNKIGIKYLLVRNVFYEIKEKNLGGLSNIDEKRGEVDLMLKLRINGKRLLLIEVKKNLSDIKFDQVRRYMIFREKLLEYFDEVTFLTLVLYIQDNSEINKIKEKLRDHNIEIVNLENIEEYLSNYIKDSFYKV